MEYIYYRWEITATMG